MLGHLVRLLPFWIREPLLILVGTVFGVRILYMALVDGEGWVPAVIGAVFLLGAALRVRVVVRALRARRRPAPSAGDAGDADEAGVAKDAEAAAPAAPRPAAPVVRRPAEKEPNAWGQAALAVGLCAVIGAAFWFQDRLPGSGDDTASRAATCRHDEDEKLPSAYRATPEAVTGEDLCRALNLPELPELLGTPTERSVYASGTNSTAPLTDRKVAQPEARVEFDTYTVELSATYNKLTVDQYQAMTAYRDDADLRKLTVLGRPALFTSDHMMQIQIDLGSGGGTGGPVEQGPLARTLTVAFDAEDRGGSYDLTVWSESGALPDDNALLGIAEAVLPRITQGARDRG
ncbi:DUF6215 domain-containing protein [Streptomyces albogriseolus]|uniref:Uncharacterized protein n=1 Tax=Streptomyces prasinosporus TaxID=68256 RepID=A0ABP6TJT2_9ACTN|nr:DUF6215 domain-containing protein [Streptomyces sp. DH20]MCP9989665.1 DUF6215 domain-containing protein [Streptomyces albogriseolus]GHB84843.1 hypothetical protein GCM10010332_05600 [Streptomyces albogriseolus]